MVLLNNSIVFPHPESNHQHDVLAVGGDLSIERLLLAYHYGIFPWFAEGDPIMWWSPRERYVLSPSRVKVSKSMRNIMNRGIYRYTLDQSFNEVIQACADIKREGQPEEGGWLSSEMIKAYTKPYEMGYAHSVEVWDDDDELVGGLYGMAIGRCFIGESMFAKASNASKFGFISLCQHLERKGFELIDGQIHNDHLESLGFEFMDRADFMDFMRYHMMDHIPFAED